MKNINYFIKIIVLFSFLLISSCGPYWYKPYGRIFTHMPKDGSPGYKLGWMHGCESGIATSFGASFIMTFYKWRKDPDLSIAKPDLNLIRRKYEKTWDINWDDPKEIQDNIRHYKKIFWIGNIFCRHSIAGTYQMAGDAFDGGSFDPPIPGEPRFVPGQHNLGNIYSFHGRGNSNLVLW